jgi:hypothetical protein
VRKRREAPPAALSLSVGIFIVISRFSRLDSHLTNRERGFIQIQGLGEKLVKGACCSQIVREEEAFAAPLRAFSQNRFSTRLFTPEQTARSAMGRQRKAPLCGAFCEAL